MIPPDPLPLGPTFAMGTGFWPLKKWLKSLKWRYYFPIPLPKTSLREEEAGTRMTEGAFSAPSPSFPGDRKTGKGNKSPLTLKEILSTFPTVLPARDCSGRVYGRLVPRERVFEVYDLFMACPTILPWLLVPTVPNECAYCGHTLNESIIKGRETCPWCAGPLSEALVRI